MTAHQPTLHWPFITNFVSSKSSSNLWKCSVNGERSEFLTLSSKSSKEQHNDEQMLLNESVMCHIACCRAWTWRRSTAGDPLAVRYCCCRGCETQHRPAQLASSPVTLSVMGKGDKRGHAQRADGKSTLGKSQNITTRTHDVSHSNLVYIVTDYRVVRC
jgi:hypothetical protein